MDSPNDQPITGFALFADGSLHLQRGYGQQQFQPCCPDQLPANDFKSLLWVIEAALGACHNELRQTMPESIQSLLRVMALCHANWLSLIAGDPPNPITGPVLVWVRPFPIASAGPSIPHIECTNAKPSGGSLCQPVADLLPRPAFPARVHPARVGHLGLVPEAGRAAVA
jgi:hypothetical protein